MAREKAKFNSRTRKLLLLVLTATVVAAAVYVFLNRETISARFASAGSGSTEAVTEPYTFESGSMQVSAAVGNGMALASTNSLQLLDASGKSAARQVYSMKMPALVTSNQRAAAFDVGGTEVCTASLNGSTAEVKTLKPSLQPR